MACTSLCPSCARHHPSRLPIRRVSAPKLITAIDAQPVSGWSDLRWRLLQLALDKKTAHIDVSTPRPGMQSGFLLDTINLPLNGLSAKDMEGVLRILGIDLARPPALLGQAAPDGPAARAGLLACDLVQRVDGVAVADGLAFVRLVRDSPGRPLHIEGQRG